MKGRVKFLGFALAAVVCLPLGERFIVRALLEPIRQRERRVAHLEAIVARAEVQWARIEDARGKLKQWASQSLPPDPATSSALYQNWLLDLATRTGLDEVSVTPNRVTSQDGSYFRIPVALQARATLDRLCDFISEFYQVGLLHRINLMRIEVAEKGDDPTLEISLNLEGAALTIATPRSTLFVDSESNRSGPEGLERDRRTHEQIVNRNLFVRGPAPERPKESRGEVKPAEPPVDHATQVFLIALLTRDSRREAWLYDRKAGRQFVLAQGDSFDTAGMSGFLAAIERDSILLDMSGATWRLELGRNLRQMTRVISSISNL